MLRPTALTTPVVVVSGRLNGLPIAITGSPTWRLLDATRYPPIHRTATIPKLMVSVEILDKWYTDHYEAVPEYMTETAKQFTPDFIGPLEAFMRVPITSIRSASRNAEERMARNYSG